MTCGRPPAVARIRFDDPGDRERWRGYLERRPDAHCTDLAEWRPLFRDLYGIEDHSFVYTDGDQVRGVLSLYHIRSPLLGAMLVTCPFFGYGGFYFDDEAARDALLERAREAAGELRVDYIEIRSRERLPPPFAANLDFSEFVLELGATADETWKARVSSNVRQNVRRSRAQALEFRVVADFEACYGLLRRTLRAHGTPFHGRRFFELLTERLGERVGFSEVRDAGRLVAAGVVIRDRQTIITPYIGSLARSRSGRANYAQYWGLIEHFAARGVRRFDMGRSPRGSTHARFKLKWGCAELPVYYNYAVVRPGGRYRSVSRPSALNLLAVRVWRRLPLAVTSALGPRLFRYIP